MEPISIIIAEDDPRNADILCRFIENLEKYQIYGVAQSLLQATELVEAVSPNLILLDNYFPDGSGIKWLQKMRKNNLVADVIMITAAKDVSTIHGALHGGVFDYIIKPIAYQRIEESLEKYQRYFGKLNNCNPLLQSDVDELLKRNKNTLNTATPRLPKGIDTLTLEKIRQHSTTLSRAFNADTIASAIGVSRTTARRYLEYLVKQQEIEVDVKYGRVGRPERFYKVPGS